MLCDEKEEARATNVSNGTYISVQDSITPWADHDLDLDHLYYIFVVMVCSEGSVQYLSAITHRSYGSHPAT